MSMLAWASPEVALTYLWKNVGTGLKRMSLHSHHCSSIEKIQNIYWQTMPVPWHWPWTQLPERASSPNLEITRSEKRMKDMVIKSAITPWALELTETAEGTRLWLPRNQLGVGNAAALTPPVLPGSASVEHWGLLHDLSDCCWLSCSLKPKIRMKMPRQHGGTQTSFFVGEEHSWHEQSILRNQGHGGRADLPVSILWTTRAIAALVFLLIVICPATLCLY